MELMMRDSGKVTLVDVTVMLCRQKKVMFLCFSCSLIVSAILIWLKPLNYDFYSVFEVGTRGLDVALERPDLLVEQMQDIYLPKTMTVHREKWLEKGDADLEVQVLYKAGSRLIKLYSQAPLKREVDVYALHDEVLRQVVLAHQERFAHIEHALVARKVALAYLTASGKGVYSELKLAENKAVLENLETQLANLSASSLGPVAVPSLKQTIFGRGELFGFALVLCGLLSLLAGAVSIFITAVRVRLD